MILFDGKLDYSCAEQDSSNLYLFTGNSCVKRNGALVMGRGAAREVRDLYPGIDKAIGACIMNHLGFYGVVGYCGPNNNIGAFQVKYNYADKARLDIIRSSVDVLNEFASRFTGMISMNYPGIGNGKVLQTDVAPLLTTLPDNVFLYKE